MLIFHCASTVHRQFFAKLSGFFLFSQKTKIFGKRNAIKFLSLEKVVKIKLQPSIMLHAKREESLGILFVQTMPIHQCLLTMTMS